MSKLYFSSSWKFLEIRGLCLVHVLSYFLKVEPSVTSSWIFLFPKHLLISASDLSNYNVAFFLPFDTLYFFFQENFHPIQVTDGLWIVPEWSAPVV